MYVYTLNGAIFCEDCAHELMFYGKRPDGPYPAGGGEADFPQHCDSCGCFLENPLTTEGMEYVYEAVARYLAKGEGDYWTIREWVEFYCIDIGELLSFAQRRFGAHQHPEE